MKLLILLSFLLSSAAVAAPITETEDDSVYQVNTYNTFPGIQTNFVYRNGRPTQVCNTYYTPPAGTSSTFCH
jgi:hypothetical protein